MDLPESYFNLYCFVLDADDTPVGSGLCVDGCHVITCAHVVNAAAGNDIGSLAPVNVKIRLSFPYNDALNQKYFAAVKFWGWKEDLIDNVPAANKRAALIRNDLALLQLDDADGELQPLKVWSDALVFLTGDISGSKFTAYSRSTADPGTSNVISGAIIGKDPPAGSVILAPDANLRTFFFGPGASGSPVFSSVYINLAAGPEEGIAGFVDFLNKLDGATDARMLTFKTINDLLLRNGIDLGVAIIDLGLVRQSLNSQLASQKIINSRGKEIYCDREPIIRIIQTRMGEAGHLANAYLIYGNERQMLDCFIDRYRVEFIAGAGLESNLISFKMPAIANKGLFCGELVSAILRASDNPFRKLPVADPALVTVKHLLDTLAVDKNACYVFDCKIENDQVSEDLREVFDWFFRDFLAPLYQNGLLVSRLHFFISFYYEVGADHTANKEFIGRFFKEAPLPELGDVSQADVRQWLAYIEKDNTWRKNLLLKNYIWKDAYAMADAVDYYREALAKIEPL